MYSQKKKQRIARIIEVPIPVAIWDMIEDLMTEYGNPITAILASIKAHHSEKFGSLEELKASPALFFKPTEPSIPRRINITDGQFAKITETSKKFEEKTKKELEKVDELLEKINALSSLQDLKEEISSVKSMLKNIQYVSTSPTARRRARADLSSLDISVADKGDIPLTPPERPSLDSVLDSVLMFDDDFFEEDNEENDEEKEEKQNTDDK